jgi:tetratricopeptide (TPR) repeat protein
VALLARRCLRGSPGEAWGAWAAGLVFALHPALAESASTIAGRSDILATLFLLLALLLALRGRDRGSIPSLAGAGALFLLALLSKEVAASGLVLLPLCLWYLPAEETEDIKPFPGWLPTAVFAGAAAVWAGIRFWAGSPLAAATFGLGEGFTRLLQAMAFYTTKIFIPWPHTPYAPELPGLLQTAAATLAVAALLGAAVFIYRRKRPARASKLPLFCAFWFAAACAPSLAVVLQNLSTATVTAERYLYLPAVGFSIAAGGAAAHLAASRFRTLAAAFAGLLLVAYAASSWQAAKIWQSDLTLWTHVTGQTTAARYFLPWLNLGNSYAERNDFDAAERFYRKALDPGVTPEGVTRALALNGLGSADYYQGDAATQAGRLDEALRRFREGEAIFSEAASLDRGNWFYRRNVALARMKQAAIGRALTGRTDRMLLDGAYNILRSALSLSPGNPELLQNLRECEALLAQAAQER